MCPRRALFEYTNRTSLYRVSSLQVLRDIEAIRRLAAATADRRTLAAAAAVVSVSRWTAAVARASLGDSRDARWIGGRTVPTDVAASTDRP